MFRQTLKSLFGRFSIKPLENVVRIQKRDLKLLATINGYGAKGLLSSKVHLTAREQPSAVSSGLPMDGVQLLTRYCAIEAPYWRIFVSHYYRLGVRCLQVCVQEERDEQEVLSLDYPEDLRVFVRRLRSDVPPDQALSLLDPSVYVQDAEFTFLVDCDEYLQPLRSDLTIRRLFELFPERGQFSIPWAMCPVLDPSSALPRCFWGNHGKAVARSSAIQAVATDHYFSVPAVKEGGQILSTPLVSMGFVLVHCLTRSFEDTLLRQMHTRFQCVKNTDRGLLMDVVRSGDLPIRLKLLAYFANQQAFLDFPVPLLKEIDFQSERQLLAQSLSDQDMALVREMFDEYRLHLAAVHRSLPTYPATTFPDLVAALPSMAELKQSRASC